MSLRKYKSIFINVENIEGFNFAECPKCNLCYVVTTLGNKTLETASAIVERSRPLIIFDTILSFPLDTDLESTITFSLRDKESNIELGKHVLAISQFINRDSSMSAKMKLKNPHEVAVGFLNAKIKMSEAQVLKASAARSLRDKGTIGGLTGPSTSGGALALIEANTADTVEEYDAVNNPTRTIQLTVFQIENLSVPAKRIRVQLGLATLETPIGNDGVVEQTFRFAYNRERFMKLFILDETKSVVAVGALDLDVFVTRRQNVMGGSLTFEKPKQGGVAGLGYFRLQRFVVADKTEVVEAERYGELKRLEYAEASRNSMMLESLGSAWL